MQERRKHRISAINETASTQEERINKVAAA
jgi:hypothetical protein